MLDQLKPLPKEITDNIQLANFRVALHGPVAVTTYIEDEHETYYGHELHCQYRATDTWMKVPAGWRLVASQVLALRTSPPAVALSDRHMQEYTGRYALTPSKIYEIRIQGWHAGRAGARTSTRDAAGGSGGYALRFRKATLSQGVPSRPERPHHRLRRAARSLGSVVEAGGVRTTAAFRLKMAQEIARWAAWL